LAGVLTVMVAVCGTLTLDFWVARPHWRAM
jgi:hypothetical protein